MVDTLASFSLGRGTKYLSATAKRKQQDLLSLSAGSSLVSDYAGSNQKKIVVNGWVSHHAGALKMLVVCVVRVHQRASKNVTSTELVL